MSDSIIGWGSSVGRWARIDNKSVIGEDVHVKVRTPCRFSVLSPSLCMQSNQLTVHCFLPLSYLVSAAACTITAFQITTISISPVLHFAGRGLPQWNHCAAPQGAEGDCPGPGHYNHVEWSDGGALMNRALRLHFSGTSSGSARMHTHILVLRNCLLRSLNDTVAPAVQHNICRLVWRHQCKAQHASLLLGVEFT